MRSYRRLCLLSVLLLAVEFFVGVGGLLTPRGEVFPFASWFLFVLVPNQPREYDLEIRAVDDSALPKPVRFSRAHGAIDGVNETRSITSFHAIQALGQALDQGDAPKISACRRQIDALLGPSHLRYDVVETVYDPVKRYDTGAILQRRVLGSFVAHEP